MDHQDSKDASANNLPSKILAVDCDRSVLQLVDTELTKYGVRVHQASDMQNALYLFNQEIFDVALVEMDLEDLPGLALIQKFRANEKSNRHHVGVILTSGRRRKPEDLALMKELGGMELIDKPVSIPKLLTQLSKALARKRASAEVDRVRGLCLDLIAKGSSVDEISIQINTALKGFDKERRDLLLEMHEKSGQPERALVYVEKALKENTNDIFLVNKKAELLRTLGRSEEARTLYEQVDQMAPNNIRRIEELASLYISARDPDKAKGKMKEMIHLHPELQDLRFNLFDDLNNAGFQEHAVKLCKEVKTSPKEIVRYYNNKGVAKSKAGDKPSALQDYYCALMYYPNYSENYRILFNIALAELEGKSEENYIASMDAIEKCLQLKPDFDKAQQLRPKIALRLEAVQKSKKAS